MVAAQEHFLKAMQRYAQTATQEHTPTQRLHLVNHASLERILGRRLEAARRVPLGNFHQRTSPLLVGHAVLEHTPS
jgi:hypothetical protein